MMVVIYYSHNFVKIVYKLAQYSPITMFPTHLVSLHVYLLLQDLILFRSYGAYCLLLVAIPRYARPLRAVQWTVKSLVTSKSACSNRVVKRFSKNYFNDNRTRHLLSLYTFCHNSIWWCPKCVKTIVDIMCRFTAKKKPRFLMEILWCNEPPFHITSCLPNKW
jgi:hypothetical protein